MWKYGSPSDGLQKCWAYYNYGEQGHISTNCHKPKKVQSGGKVFALIGSETTSSERLIRGVCFINSISLISIIDTRATYSFISLDYDERLSLKLSFRAGSMIVDTLALGPRITLLVCLNCPLIFIVRVLGRI